MLSVRCIKPYSVKVDSEYIYVTLDCYSFTIAINEIIFHFIPTISNVIKVDRRTKKVKNTEAIFSFQNEDKTIHISMSELICLPEFLYQLTCIVEPFYKEEQETVAISETEHVDVLTDLMIEELEQINVRTLIDQALDERDEEKFYQLTKYLT
ncbi:MAG TPA: IDEAL domain-containing protein [Virgibacillus sp.]|nr:IDEAL domain-containing protein [Virgibacillus sp.]